MSALIGTDLWLLMLIASTLIFASFSTNRLSSCQSPILQGPCMHCCSYNIIS
ncbi:hypothetical protein K503DRAFT_770845, partial [Rhizopogon vinicolor AM-OR11-026]